MTTREYLVFSFALVQAGVGVFSLEQPGAKLPPGMSIANVNFAKVHKEAIDALGAVAKSQCDEDDSRN
jgi:hypothetical protein